jgi:uncharacterized membrane protein YebE (DUF533 family)
VDTVVLNVTKEFVSFQIAREFEIYVSTQGLLTAVFAVVAYKVYKQIKRDRLSKRVNQAFAELGIEKPDNLIDFDDWDK